MCLHVSSSLRLDGPCGEATPKSRTVPKTLRVGLLSRLSARYRVPYAPQVPDRDPSYQADCLFCRLAAGEIPSNQVLADDAVIVFRDINPRAPTHLLAIPRRHVASADDLTQADGDMLAALFSALRTAAAEEGTRGYRIVTNVGPESGQSVFHLHFHLLGGRLMSWPPG